jgi:hypothetical protein
VQKAISFHNLFYNSATVIVHSGSLNINIATTFLKKEIPTTLVHEVDPLMKQQQVLEMICNAAQFRVNSTVNMRPGVQTKTQNKGTSFTVLSERNQLVYSTLNLLALQLIQVLHQTYICS